MPKSNLQNKPRFSQYIIAILLSFSFLVSPVLSLAASLMYTATTFADFSDDIRVGIEIEFTGLSLNDTLNIVHSFSGGTIAKKEKRIKTTLKEVTAAGMVFNEEIIPEWVINSPIFGELVIKVDNNQVTDDSVLDPKDTVLELVTSPIRKTQVIKLQEILTALEEKGARGTADGESVSIQYNTEINNGNVSTFKWQKLVDLMRVYFNSDHRTQIDAHLNVPEFRKDYVASYSPGFLARLFQQDYHPSARELVDDFFYRQSLEILGFQDAWTMEISKARQLLLSQKNPVVPLVAKQNKLRISSLLAMTFPEDPIVKIYMDSGWISPMPIVEWREFNNDFNVLEHYREVMGLMYMTDKYGAFDHDTLMSSLSGIEKSMIADLRQRSFKQIKNDSAPTVFRYFIGDPSTVNRSEYAEMKQSYGSHPVGFLPFYQQGLFPVSIPGESVVMHRNQFHRNNIVGKYNVSLMNGFIAQALENKYVEMKFWNDYVHNGIPQTQLLSELGVSSVSGSNIINQLQQTLGIFNKNFPNGWVLKGLFDLGTEKDIISDKTDLMTAVGTYLNSDFEQFKIEVNKKYAGLQTAPEYALSELKEHKGYKGWKILQLLNNTKSVIIQERYNIIREFRVEVVAGQVLGKGSTMDRYAYTFKKNGKQNSSYEPPKKKHIQMVEAFANEMMDSLPAELRNMTFGLDVAIVQDGNDRKKVKAVLIESNPGGNSNFLYEEEDSSVKELTKFLLKFPSLVNSGMIHPGFTGKAQMQFLKKKFAEWNIDVPAQYPGMRFLSDRIEDLEFKNLTLKKTQMNLMDSTGQAKTSGVRCEALFN